MSVAWPKDYIARKLEAHARLSALDDADAAQCAQELWDLLIEAESLANKFKAQAAEAAEAVERTYDAVSGLVDARKTLVKMRRTR